VPGVAIVGLLAVALVVARSAWLGAVLGLLAVLYFGHVLLVNRTDVVELGLVAVALLLVGELGQWSIDARLTGRHEAGLHRSRAAGIAWLAILGAATVLVSGLAGGLPIGGGIGSLVIAMAASVAVLGLISMVALRGADVAADQIGRDPS
jgi:hypothetical protein